MKKRIISFMIMLSLVLSQGVSYAAIENIEGIDYIDDIYRFDVPGANSTGDMRLEILTKLGIVENSQENPFDEKSFVTRSELKNTALKAAGKQPLYREDKQRVRLFEVYEELLKTLGYLWEDSEADNAEIVRLADSADLSDGIQISEGEYVSNADFVRVLFNALTAEYGNYPVYMKNGPLSDGTLLSDVFNTICIKGFVNGIEGMNLYDDSETRAGYVKIDRSEYAVGDTNAEKFFAKRVRAYACYSEDTDEYTLIWAEQESDSGSVVLEFEDIYDVDSGKIYYVNSEDKEKTVNISKVKAVVYNGKYMTGENLTNLIAETDGRVELAATQKGGSYDMAIVWTYRYYAVDTIDVQEEVIRLKYNAKWDTNSYIPIEENARTRVFMNGAIVDWQSLMTNDVIRVLATYDRSYMEISAARTMLTGDVTEVDETENTVYISGTKYKISEDYNTCVKDSASGLKRLKTGMTGTFYISEDSKVVGFRQGSQYSFGYLKKIIYDEETETYSLKYLSQDGDWRTSKLSKKPTLDGEKMTHELAGKQLLQNKSDIVENIFRYKSDGVDILNGNDSLLFVDTMTDTEYEKNDTERMTYCGSFENFMNYRCIYLIGSNYQLSADTVIFRVPDNLNDEDDFAVIRNTQLPWGDESIMVPLELYNPNRYYLIGAAIYKGGEQAVGSDGYILIEKISPYYDEEEEELAYNVTGLYLNDGACEEKQYTVSKTVADKMKSFAVGDLNRYAVNGDVISGVQDYWGSAWSLPAPQSIYKYHDYHYISGTVIERDPDNNLLVVDYGNSKIAVTRVPNKVAVIDKTGTKNKARVSDYSAIQIGDRVFFYDIYAYSNWCVVEKK